MHGSRAAPASPARRRQAAVGRKGGDEGDPPYCNLAVVPPLPGRNSPRSTLPGLAPPRPAQGMLAGAATGDRATGKEAVWRDKCRTAPVCVPGGEGLDKGAWARHATRAVLRQTPSSHLSKHSSRESAGTRGTLCLPRMHRSECLTSHPSARARAHVGDGACCPRQGVQGLLRQSWQRGGQPAGRDAWHTPPPLASAPAPLRRAAGRKSSARARLGGDVPALASLQSVPQIVLCKRGVWECGERARGGTCHATLAAVKRCHGGRWAEPQAHGLSAPDVPPAHLSPPIPSSRCAASSSPPPSPSPLLWRQAHP